jgi:hypothetical protein
MLCHLGVGRQDFVLQRTAWNSSRNRTGSTAGATAPRTRVGARASAACMFGTGEIVSSGRGSRRRPLV